MENSISTAINIFIPFGLILVGLVAGTILETRHYASIRSREKSFAKLPIITIGHYEVDKTILKSYLVSGSVVISTDYFKRFLAALRQIFGGNVRAYESLVDRARREAMLRMKAKCPAADIIMNLKIETSSISKQYNGQQRSVGCVEVIAYGTAIKFD